jgi:hypothetical protein
MSFTASSSFNSQVRVRHSKKNPAENGTCDLKRHFDKALREVVGRIDLLAKLDKTGERFVFEKQMRTALGTYRWENRARVKKLSHRTVKRMLHTLREWHIVSDRLSRIRNGRQYWGYIVAEHNSVCFNDGKTCTLIVPDFNPDHENSGPPRPGCLWVWHYAPNGVVEYESETNPFWAPKGWIGPR